MMMRNRFVIVTAASLAYMVFAIVAYPLFSVSVFLPSIMLCGLASWLYGWKIGLLTAILSHPYHMLVMILHLDSLQAWRSALDIGGAALQLGAVFSIAAIRNNQNQSLKITESLEMRIRERNEELKRIAEYMKVQSKADRSRMSETLCNIVAYQQTALIYHSESLINYLTYNGAPQIKAATKLIQFARQSMEQIENTMRRLSPDQVVANGIAHALGEMCADFEQTTETVFTLSLSPHTEKLPEKTALNIYRIAHEAVCNALRHGKATHIDLLLKLDEQSCILEVINNGNPMSSTPVEGLGMRLMQQRADIINAIIRFETTPRGETRFKCIVPLPFV